MALNKKMLRAIADNPEQYREAMLSKHQADIVKLIEVSVTMTTRDLATMKNVSVQNGSQQLRILWRKGYLKREELVDESGGLYHQYYSAI